MSRHSAPLPGGFCRNFPLSKESSYRACKACEQQPSQPIGRLDKPSTQYADSKPLRVTCTREFSTVQSVNFSRGTYISGRTVSITSKDGHFSQSNDFFLTKCSRQDMERICRETWSLPVERERKGRKASELGHENIARERQSEFETENWRKSYPLSTISPSFRLL